MMKFGPLCRFSLSPTLPTPVRLPVLVLCAVFTGCGGPPLVAGAPGPMGGAWSYVYSCGENERFSARLTEAIAYLNVDGRAVDLARDPQSSGRYSGDGYTFTRGDERATLVTPDRNLGECVGEPAASVWEDAALRGVTYRAVGQEPGWYVEVTPGRSLLYVGDYGQTVILGDAPTVAADEASGRTMFDASSPAGAIVLSVDRHTCIDVMSGEGYPTRAIVSVAGETHQGCGLSLDR